MRKVLQILRLQDWITLFFGVGLFASPWLFGFTDLGLASWNAWLCGAVIVIASAVALLALEQIEEWYGIALGLWLVAAPFVLGFAPINGALGAHVVFGVAVIASEAWEIWQVRHEPRGTPVPT